MNFNVLDFSIRIDALRLRIANILIMNEYFRYNQYSNYSGNKNHDNFAGKLLNEINAELTNTLFGFCCWITGTGWRIQYLVKNKSMLNFCRVIAVSN